MDQRKIDVRLQLKDAPGAGHMFGKKECPRNELVIRLTPNESIFIRANVKAPGLSMAPVQSELDLTYRDRYGDTFKNQPSAYARMILNVRSSSANSKLLTHLQYALRCERSTRTPTLIIAYSFETKPRECIFDFEHQHARTQVLFKQDGGHGSGLSSRSCLRHC